MANDLDWHKWYYARWERDEFVKTASLEVLGAYLTLLQAQMNEGDLPDNVNQLALLVGHGVSIEQFQRMWVDLGMKDKFHPATEQWVVTGNYLTDGYWEPLPNPKPGRIHQRFLTQVMTIDKKNRASKAAGGKKSFEVRTKSLESSIEAIESPAFDFKPILSIFPRRKVKGEFDKAGWEGGVALLKYIVSQDEYDRLLAATKNYARQRRGEDPAFHLSFKKFMETWEMYVPQNYQKGKQEEASPAPVAVDPAAPQKPRWRIGEKPPWFIGPYDRADVKLTMAKTWADRAKREAWLEENGYPKAWADVGYEAVN